MPVVKALIARPWHLVFALGLGCVTPHPAEPKASPPPDEAAHVVEVARAFASSARERRFDVVWGLLSERWRTRTTPGRLAADFDLEPLAEERLKRVEAALAARPQIEGDAARLPLGPGRALVLVHEETGWRIDRLE